MKLVENIRKLLDETAKNVKAKPPKIYSRELMTFCSNSLIVEGRILSRQA